MALTGNNGGGGTWYCRNLGSYSGIGGCLQGINLDITSIWRCGLLGGRVGVALSGAGQLEKCTKLWRPG